MVEIKIQVVFSDITGIQEVGNSGSASSQYVIRDSSLSLLFVVMVMLSDSCCTPVGHVCIPTRKNRRSIIFLLMRFCFFIENDD
jgi:hypothetical protein